MFGKTVGILLLNQLIEITTLTVGCAVVVNPCIGGVALPGVLVAILLCALFVGLLFVAAYAGDWSGGLILGGAASNVLDRMLHGGAVDYFSLGPLTINGADVCICVGLFLFMREMKRI